MSLKPIGVRVVGPKVVVRVKWPATMGSPLDRVMALPSPCV